MCSAARVITSDIANIVAPAEPKEGEENKTFNWKMGVKYMMTTGFKFTAGGKQHEEAGQEIAVIVSESGALANLAVAVTAILAVYAF